MCLMVTDFKKKENRGAQATSNHLPRGCEDLEFGPENSSESLCASLRIKRGGGGAAAVAREWRSAVGGAWCNRGSAEPEILFCGLESAVFLKGGSIAKSRLLYPRGAPVVLQNE
mmetsp:Transcript_17177/g.43941  ORF Transcript_17177/g.43941 Transcript_17177/m.43941 type:complete len:114 (-) Transcript_17177:52-393(-)